MNPFTEDTKELIFAHQVVKEFFDYTHVLAAVADIKRVVMAANSSNAATKRAGNLLYFQEQFTKMITAAFVFNDFSANWDWVSVAPDEHRTHLPDMTRQQDFVEQLRNYNAWTFFPRHLSVKQYLQPAIAIEKFAQYKTELEWKTIFSELVTRALTKSKYSEFDPGYNVFKVQQRLIQLTEAMFLIHVRIKNKGNKKLK